MALDGGGSNAVRAGGAYVEVSAKNNLAPGLNAAKADISAFSASQSAYLSPEAKKFLGDKDNKNSPVKSLTNFKEGLGKVAIGIGLVTAAAHGMWIAFGGRQALEKFNDELERMNRISDKALKIAERRKALRDERLGIGNPAEQKKYIEDITKQTTDEVAALAEQLNRARAQLENAKKTDKLPDWLNAYTQSAFAGLKIKETDIPIIGEGKKAELSMFKDVVNQLQEAYDQAKTSQEEYAKRQREINDPNKSVEAIKAVDELTKSLLNQADALGKTAEEAKLIEMGRGIFSPEQMKRASAAVTQFKADKLAFDVKELTRSFKEQAAVLGMTSEGAEIYKKKIEGATESQLAASRAAAIELAQGRANLARQDVYDEQAEKARTRMEDLKNSFATAFRNTDTAGSFDFGGGGQYTSMGDTLKDQLEVSRAIRKINEDLLKETKKLSADQFR